MRGRFRHLEGEQTSLFDASAYDVEPPSKPEMLDDYDLPVRMGVEMHAEFGPDVSIDVDSPDLGQAKWPRFTRGPGESFRRESMNFEYARRPHTLAATQRTMTPDQLGQVQPSQWGLSAQGLSHYLNEGEGTYDPKSNKAPVVVKPVGDDRLYAVDGHHRITAAKVKGESVDVRYTDESAPIQRRLFRQTTDRGMKRHYRTRYEDHPLGDWAKKRGADVRPGQEFYTNLPDPEYVPYTSDDASDLDPRDRPTIGRHWKWWD